MGQAHLSYHPRMVTFFHVSRFCDYYADGFYAQLFLSPYSVLGPDLWEEDDGTHSFCSTGTACTSLCFVGLQMLRLSR